MARIGPIEKYRSYLLFASILGIFLSGFFLLNSLFAWNSKDIRTVVLDKNLFHRESPINRGEELSIKKVTKLDTPYPIWDAGLINSHSLVLSIPDYGAKTKQDKLISLNLNTNTYTELFAVGGTHFLLSPDGKNLFAHAPHSVNAIPKTAVYEIQTKGIQNTFDGLPLSMLPDSNRYLGLSDDSLFVQNINTGERIIVMTLADTSPKSGVRENLQPEWFIKMADFIIPSLDGRSVYFLGRYGDSTALYRIDLTTANSVDLLITGDILDFAPLENGKLLISGTINGIDGLFLFNMQDKTHKLLAQGNISDVHVAPDGKIAYISVKEKKISELHVARLLVDSIELDKLVYSDMKNISFLKWDRLGNMLYCVSVGLNESSILRFSFS
ncbi:hypothetical protein [Paenibacillus sedimenti]|uniref:Uncharacterized protein n=1 Tax=Paenibacillus sedimenti TaxID=2770274 RepID=A0A926KYY4_9BACL|nr:hypothetical protein [Paenibacillus sedimenti]MBD0384674.1 hypothetical protein [Paenibacillus sedimenti]